jgi:UPF0271 protein
MRIDLNADVGEGFETDAALMLSITSANVAAGLHAGDPSMLRATIRLAKRYGVAVGAHPGFADRDGFGRRELRLRPEQVEDLVLYQIAAVAGVAFAEGVTLQHVKPHGALYNMAARDRTLADAIARAVLSFDRSLILVGLPDSAMLAAGRSAGLTVVAEAFGDRAYERDGSLVSRDKTGAVLQDASLVVARAVRMVREHSVETIEGSSISIYAETLCVHGDTPDAPNLAATLRAGLEAAGIEVKAGFKT